MQFEDFDKKIIEAADNHHPAYDEQAWAKMEKLLNKYLPQKTADRRRFIFFLLFSLLLGGGIFLFINKPWQHAKPVAASDNTARQTISPATNATAADNKNDTRQKTKIDIKNQESVNNNDVTGNAPGNVPAVILQTSTPKINSIIQKSNRRKKQNSENLVSVPIKKPVEISKLIAVTEKPINATDKIIISEPVKNNIDQLSNNNVSKPVTDVDAALSEKTVTDQKPVNDNESKTTTKTENTIVKKAKEKNRKTNSFFLSLSAGPDVSAAGSDKLGKMKLLTGAGLGFTFKDRLTIRTGFYSTRKIYTASPGEYHPPAAFWTYYPNLQKVEADCRVYEIPLSLSYHFGRTARQSWFATAGTSTYLMKRETYEYSYKNAAGQLRYRKSTLINKNKHYFSVLTLGGGYQRNINKTFSFMVEPYVKIPFGGVGYGKVKLNSGGALLSVAVKPFGNRSLKPRQNP